MAPTTIAVLNGTSRVNRHIIDQALAAGQHVRALVRSTSRFYASTQKHAHLTAHEWADFSDIAALATILDGVDVVYIALCAPAAVMHRPSWLNADAVASVCTVLHGRVAPGARSGTKVVLLAAHGALPGAAPPRGFVEAILGNQFRDLRAAQTYLHKQHGWLDVVYVAPGPIIDSEPDGTGADAARVRLEPGGPPRGPVSYARLAAAMQRVAADAQWHGKFVLPVPTDKVPMSIRHVREPMSFITAAVTNQLLPAVGRVLWWASLGSALGYVVGSRDGGQWALRVLGVNVRRS